MPRWMPPLSVRHRSALWALRRAQSGVTAIEYALIAAFISIVIVAAVTRVGTSVCAFFTTVANGF